MENKIIEMLQTLIDMHIEDRAELKELKTDIAELKTDVKTLKSQRMIDTNNLALVLNQQTKMLKMLEDIYGNSTHVNYVM